MRRLALGSEGSHEAVEPVSVLEGALFVGVGGGVIFLLLRVVSTPAGLPLRHVPRHYIRHRALRHRELDPKKVIIA